MATTPNLRPPDSTGVDTTAPGGLPGRVLVAAVLALAFAVLAVGSLALLAGSRARTAEVARPAFLAAALGTPQDDAPLVRRPARGIELRADGNAVAVRRDGADAALVSTHGATGEWRRFEHGATRRTAFGSETVVFLGADGVEQFLNVDSRVGRRTWRWRIDATGRPQLARDGSVSFVSAAATTGLRIAPVQIFDARRRDVTPAGLRWSLARRDAAWWLELSLDDRRLPVPYVIDPAITQSGANSASRTSSPLTITRPGAVGDLLVAQVAVRSTGAITAPAGWTLLSSRSQSNIQQAVYWKVATGSEGTQWSWSGGGMGAGGIVAYANPHPTSPIDLATDNSGSSATASATGGTAALPDEMVTALSATVGQKTMTQTAGQGVAQVYADGTTGGGPPGNRISVLAADGVQAAAGTVSTKTAGLSASDNWVAHLVSIRQAPDDGSGSLAADTSAVAASSTGHTIVFTYTAGLHGMADGAIALAVPSGWTAPSTAGSSGGYTTASTGSVSAAGQTITVSGVTLAPGATMTITYGSTASGGPGATASAAGGSVTWQSQQRGTAAGTLADVASPTIDQYAADGTGTLTVSPTTVDVGAAATLTFTYTAAAGGTSDGAVTVAVPSGWTAPGTTAGSPGHTTATAGTVSTAGQTITVSGVTLAGGATLTIAYGAGAGGTVTVPSGTGSQTWQARQRSVAGGTLTDLASSPSVTLNNVPTASVSLSPSAPATGATLTATATTDDLDGDPVTLTYVWKVDGVTRKTTSATASLTDTLDLSAAGNGDRGQTVSVQVTPNDGRLDGTTAGDAEVVANSAPALTSVSIDQASPRTDDTLTVTVSSTDGDGDAVAYAYQWRRNGVDIAGETGATLDLSTVGAGDKGDDIGVRVTAHDGTDASAPSTSGAVTILNTAPVIDAVSVDQASPTTADTLTLTVSSHDDDGDPVTYAYQWQKDGADLAGETGPTLDLFTAGNGDVGEALRARVTGSDGSLGTAPVTSAAVTVVNAAPTATVSLAPASPTTDATLTATATAADVDGHAVALTYVWKVDGVTRKTTSATASLTDAFDLAAAGNGDRGETVSVEVTPNDGFADGAPATDSEVVANSAPTVDSVAIDQAAPRTDDTLTVSVTAADADGDPVAYAYQWRRDGVDVPGETGATLDLSAVGDKGDAISVRVTASDGDTDSTPLTTAPVTIANSTPTVTSVAIDQVAPETDDTLTLTVVASDPDGDPTTLTYQWARNGVDRFGETGATYDLSVFENGQKGDDVTVRVTADDGSETSAAVTSAARTVANAAPVLGAVAIDQAAPATDDTLTATISATDADGDALTTSRQWRRNGVDLAGETGAGLDLAAAGNGDKGDAISLRVTVSDGTEGAGPLTSGAVTVLNSPPTVTSVAIDDAAPATDETLGVTVVSADADADPRTYAYQWQKDGVDLAGQTGATLDLSAAEAGDKGDAITVRVTASDGTASSAPATSAAVTVENSLPVATVSLAPASPTTDGTLTATATKADADGDAVTLTYVWKVDGVVVRTTPATGTVTDALDLSVHAERGEVVSVDVTPDDGESAGVTVGDAETVADSVPSATVSLAPGSPATGQTVTATATTADADGDPVALTYVWKVDGVTRKTTPASSSLTDTFDLSPAGNGDKGQTVTVDVTPTDGTLDGATATVAETVANTAPTIDSAAIDQPSPLTNDTLTATVTGTDADGDPVTHAYQWRRNGADLPGQTGATLDLSLAGDKGDTITLRVTATDGDADSTPLTTAPVTIQNSEPAVTVALSPDPAGTNDLLTATAATSDADGDPVTLTYVWKVNGATVRTTAGSSSLTDALDLAAAGNGDAGDTVSVDVTPSDGADDGTAAGDALGIGNALPVATVSLVPAAPATDEVVTATATAADTDGGPVTLTYVWKVDGAVVRTTAGTSSLTDMLDLAVHADREQVVAVEVTPNDGAGDGTTATASDTVANSAPTVDAVAIDQAGPRTNDLLSVSVTSSDADGDARTYAYQWRRDGADLPGQTGPTLDLGVVGDAGDEISVRVTADDGTDASVPVTSSAVTVENTAPVVDTVAIDQAAPRTDDVLTVSVTSSDADGDARAYAYQWRVGGADVPGQTGATLDLSVVGDRGDAISVRVTASDGSDASAPLTSAPVSVANSAPVVVSATIDEAAPRTGDTAGVTVVASDADGDAVALAYQWSVNGVDRFGATAGTYDLGPIGNGDKGDEITVRVTADDGTDAGAPVTSGARTVANSAPTLAVAIAEATAATDDTLTADVSAADADGDAVTLAYAWTRNGGPLAGETAAALDLSVPGNGDRGDTIALAVTADDGDDAAGPVAGAPLVVANSAPTVASVTIVPAAPTTDAALTATSVTGDADGDPVVVAYQWTKNGADLPGATGPSLDLSAPGNGDRGDELAVRVTAGDGTDTSAPSTSAVETVANAAPVCSPVTLDTVQDVPTDGAPLCTDADGDAVAPAIVAQGTKGAASVVAGQLRYVPDAGEKGADAFTYRGSDGTDASTAATVNVTIDDVTAPETTIDAGPAAGSTTSSTGATLAFSADEAGSSFECRVDGGGWGPCTSPETVSGLGEGSHVFEVQATDDHANTDPTPAARSWTVDTTAPETTLDAAPADPSGDDTPSFAFSADDGDASFECRLDGGAWAPCTSPHAPAALADGAHAFEVRATDPAGNVDATPATHAWTVDTVPPTVVLDDPGASLSGTVGLTASAGGGAVSVRFEVSPAGAGAWTTIATDADGGDGWSADWATSGDGLHDLRAVATDAAANTAASAVVDDRLVDNGAPTMTIASPTATGWVAADPFTVTATTPDLDVASVAVYACSDAGCAGGTQTLLGTDADGSNGWSVSAAVPADGRWTLRAVATDGAGNAGEDVVDAQVDRTAPSGGSVAYPHGFDADGTVVVTTTDGADAGSGLDLGSAVLERDAAPHALGACGVFSGTWTPVASPDTGLADGWCYVYRYRIADEAGNEATYASANVVVVDTAAPVTTDDAPAGWSGSDVTVTLSAADAVSGVAAVEVRVDGGAWAAYAGPFTLSAHGTHTIEYRSTDVAGNEEPVRTATVRIDTLAPSTSDDAPAGWRDAAVDVTLTADDGGDSGVAATEHRVDGGAWTPGASLTLGASGTHLVEYRSTDAAGNLEPTRSATVRVDVTAPSVAITVPGGGDLVSGTLAITSTQTDVHSGIDAVEYQISPAGEADWQTTSSAWDTTALADGAYDLRALATDVAGNTAVSALVAGVQVDNDPPALSFDAPADGGYVNAGSPDPLPLQATAADDGTGVRDVEFFECTTAGPACSTFSTVDLDATGPPFSALWTLPADGERVLRAVATDDVGHAVEELVTVTVDRTAPSAPLTLPGSYDSGSALYVAGTAALVSAAADATSGVDTVVFQQLPGTGIDTDADAPFTSDWDTNALADGPYDLRAFVTDRAGNATAGAPVAVHVDNTAPTTTDDAPAAWQSAPTTVSFSAADGGGSGVAQTAYRVDGGAWETAASVTIPAPASHANDGVHTIEYRSTDNVGTVEATRTASVRIDTTAPATTDDAPAGWAATDVDVTLAADDGAGASGVAQTQYRVDGGAWQTGTTVALAPAAGTEDAYLVEYRSTDAAGNVEPTRSVTVRIDKAAPATSDDAPTGWQRLPVTVALTADDGPGSGVDGSEHRVDGGAWTDGTSVAVPTASGDHVVEYRSTDAVGNAEATQSVTVRMDTTPPATTDDAPSAPSSVPVTVGLSPTDGHAGVALTQYRVDGGAWQAGTSVAIPAPADTSRDVTIEYRSTDAVGNVETIRTAVVTIDTLGPSGGPVDPGSFISGSVTLAANPADDSGIVSVQFESSPAGMDAWAPIGTPILAPPFETVWVTSAGSPADGDYDLRVTVVDGAGNTSHELLPGVPKTVDNTSPTGSVTAPAGPYVSGTATVAATASDTPTATAVASVEFEVKDADDAGYTPLGSDTTAPYTTAWDTTAAPDGPAELRVIVRDVAGNAPTTSAVHTVTVDNDAPTVSLDDPGAYGRGTVALAASGAADITSVRFERRAPGDPGWTTVATDSTAGDGFTADLDTPGAEGPVELRAVAVDGSGNEGASAVRTLLADNTPPTGSVTRPDDGDVVGGPSVPLETNAADAASGVASVAFEFRAAGDPGAFTSIAGATWDASGLPTGSYELRAVVADHAGNVHTTGAVTVTVDSSAPTVSIDSPGASLLKRVILGASVSGAGAVSVAFSIAPAGSGAWTPLGTAASHPWTIEFDTEELADGLYDLRAVVADAFGNTNEDVLAGVALDNTKPRVVSSSPADGSTLAAAAGVDVTVSEPLAAVASATLDGAPVTIMPSGASFSVPTAGLADGPHTLAGTLRDPAGRERAFRVHFTLLGGGTPADVPYVEKNARAGGSTTLAAADGSATATMPAGAYADPGDGDWLVLRVDPVPAASITGSATLLGSAIVDVTARWALAGVEQHEFDVPIDILLPGSGASGLIPATYEGDAWRPLERVAGPGALPAGRSDGYYVDGAGTHVVTRHLSLFALLLDVEPPAAPYDLAGVVAKDGLTLRWVPGRDNSGLSAKVVELWVDGAPFAAFGPRQFEVKLGDTPLDDGRRFQFRQQDEAGNWSALTPPIVAIGPVEGMTLAEANAEMARRGLAVGTVIEQPSAAPAGTVIGFRARVQGDRYFEPGRAVDLVVSGGAPAAGEARLVVSVVGTKLFSWKTGRTIGTRITASRASRVTVSLISPRGARLYTWRFAVRAGTTVKRLRMPTAVRRAGRYRLVVTATSGGQVVRRTVTVQIAGATGTGGSTARKRPVEVVLAGSSLARARVARGLGVPRARILAGDAESTFELAGSPERNVRVVVVDVDEHGLLLVRDLRRVFPSVDVVALAATAKARRRALALGARAALPADAGAARIARTIRSLAP